MNDALFTLVTRGLLSCGLSCVIGCGGKDAAQNPNPIQEAQAQPQPAPAVQAQPLEELTDPKTVDLIQAASLGNVNDVKFHLRSDPEALHRTNAIGMYPIHMAAMIRVTQCAHQWVRIAAEEFFTRRANLNRLHYGG